MACYFIFFSRSSFSFFILAAAPDHPYFCRVPWSSASRRRREHGAEDNRERWRGEGGTLTPSCVRFNSEFRSKFSCYMAWVYISPRGRYCPVGPHDSRLRQPTTPHASSNANSSVRGIARDTSPRRRSCLPTSRTAGKALTQHVEIFPCSGVLW